MSKLQSSSGIATGTKLHKARDVRPEESASAQVSGSRNRIGHASDQGVWSAALCLAFVAFLMPVWFLGVGSVFGASREANSLAQVHFAQIATLAVGACVLWCGAGASILMARAPRLGGGMHGTWLRWFAVAAIACSALFIRCCFGDLSQITGDAVAYAGAVMPAVLLAEVSFALPAIAKNRYGVDVGWYGGIAWIATGFTVIATGFAPDAWWLPTVVATVGAYCTGMAAVRVWRRYEGRIVGA